MDLDFGLKTASNVRCGGISFKLMMLKQRLSCCGCHNENCRKMHVTQTRCTNIAVVFADQSVLNIASKLWYTQAQYYCERAPVSPQDDLSQDPDCIRICCQCRTCPKMCVCCRICVNGATFYERRLHCATHIRYQGRQPLVAIRLD